MKTRREFLSIAAAVGSTTMLRPMIGMAEPFGLPLGLQLYSVRDQLKQDFDGTLAELSKLGYREVEAAGFYDKTPEQVRKAFASAGLRCVSSHTPQPVLAAHLDETISYLKALKVDYLVCSSPGHKTPGGDGKLTLDDWRWNAEQFNRYGESCRAAGIKFGYHNHVAEFGAIDGVVPYEELMRLTDPAKVTFEMDCGWVVVGGSNPVEVMQKHPGRVSMLHIKDFKSVAPGEGEHEAAELGHGSIDYAPIFAEAKKSQKITHAFVEQEHFDKPYQDALRLDAEYLRRFS